ncbi:hypothetical protein SprV_0902667600 [Sparganum proliferum]
MPQASRRPPSTLLPPRGHHPKETTCPLPADASAAATNTSTTTIIIITISPTPLTAGAISDIQSTSNITNIPIFSDVDSVHTCPHCDRTFTSHISPSVTCRIHREPVPPNYTPRIRHHCPHCPRTLTHRMDPFGRMLIHDSGIHCSLDAINTPGTFTMPNPDHVPIAQRTANQQLHHHHYRNRLRRCRYILFTLSP